MFWVGADVCKGHWFTVKLAEGNNWEVNRFPNIEKLWEEYKDAKLILLDIPIGLPHRDHNVRFCDIEARKLLGKRRSSVFPAPCRCAVWSDSYKKASKINKEEIGRGLSLQTWGIIPEVREVDQFLSGNVSARLRIREIHPEVCFRTLAGRPMTYSKKKADGYSERMEVLSSVYPYTQEIVDYALREYPRSELAGDDILDALVAAVTAYKGRQGLKSIPEAPEFDSHGLPMEMIYCLS